MKRLSARRRTRGQSLVELALALPVLLLIVLVTIDFGRAFSGYITLTNATRIGANYAASHPTAWGTPGNAGHRAEYQAQILRDTNVANCALVGGTPPAPTFTDGSDSSPLATDVGDRVGLGLSCTFQPITPIIGAIVGNSLVMSANSNFAVKAGLVAGVPIPPVPPAPTPGPTATPGPTPTPTPTPTPGATPTPTPTPTPVCVVVPSVTGMTPATANATISGVGLVPNGIGDLTTGTKNSARNQSPTAGSCVPPGTTVTYHYRPL